MRSEVGAACASGGLWVGLWPVCVWPVGVWCLSSLSERFSRKGVDEWSGPCSLITCEATTAERQTHKQTNT